MRPSLNHLRVARCGNLLTHNFLQIHSFICDATLCTS
nr:MAG TPA: hypothetical protein [Caudoviricetes sp.]